MCLWPLVIVVQHREQRGQVQEQIPGVHQNPVEQWVICGSEPVGQLVICGSESVGQLVICGSEPVRQLVICGSEPVGQLVICGSEPIQTVFFQKGWNGNRKELSTNNGRHHS